MTDDLDLGTKEYTCEIRKLYHLLFKSYGSYDRFFLD